MKGLILLFICVAFGAIGWRYMDQPSKDGAKRIASQNIGAIIIAAIVVAVAIFVSTNTTLRLV